MQLIRRYFSLTTGDADTLSRARPKLAAAFTHFKTDFQDALQVSKDELRYLVVYHYSPVHARAHEIESFACDTQIARLINDNCVLFVSDVSTPLGRKLEELHDIASFPSLAFAFPFGGPTGKVLEVVRARDITSATVRHICEQNMSLFDAQRARQHEEDERRAVREEQEAAYNDALARAQQEEEAKQQAEEAARVAQERAEAEAKERDEKQQMRDDMNAKAQAFASEAEPSGDASCTIAVRFPNGKRVRRRFLRSDRVGKVYDFVDASQCVSRDYTLVRMMPKRALGDRDATLEEEKLTPSAALVLEIN